MLIQILNYLKREKMVTNQQLVREFKLDLSALQPMLDVWIKRGKIACCQEEVQGCQKGCLKNCRKQEPPIYYRFVS